MTAMALANKTNSSTTSGGGKQPPATGAPKGGIRDYALGVKSEWHKITWPTWPQIWAKIVAVLVVVTIMTLGLFLIDNGIHAIISALPGKIL